MEQQRPPSGRGQGRKKVEGTRRMYIVPDDVHEWITSHGGSKYLTEIIRAIKAVSTPQNERK